jgi:hypothetical protein
MKIQNGVECPGCHDRLFSNSRHDFVGCKCDATFIDGGLDYQRVGFNPEVGIPIKITREIPDSGPTSWRYRDERTHK